jgi:hypothetical protein
MRRKALAANSFLLNSRQSPKTDQYIDQYGFSVDGPIFKNKTFFLFVGEKYREGTPAPLFGAVPTPAFKNGDFSNLVDASGRLITIYDPNTGRDVNGVWTRDPFPNNRIPAERINPTARAIMKYWPDPNNVDPSVAPWQRNLAWAEHFNKDLFWNWVGKVDHNFGANDRAFFRWGENERNEVGNRGNNAIQSGPGQGGQLPLWRANRALVGDWVHIFGPGSVFNLRGSYTYFLEWSYSEYAIGFDSTEFWPSSLVSQFPSKDIGGIFPVIAVDEFITLSRGSSPNRNRNYTIQPNVSLTRGAHNIRSGLDLRWTNVFNENYNNSGANISFSRQFTQRTQTANVLEGNAFASFLLGAPSGGNVDVNPKPHYKWFFLAPWIQDDWRVTNKLTLNLGFRWDFNGSVTEEDNMLNYAFDPTIVNPISARVGQQVMGGLRFAGVDGAPVRPWKYDKNNYQARAGATFQINEKTVLRGGYGKYFLNPTSQSFNAGFSQSTTLIASTDGNRTPTYALSNPFPNGIQTPSGSSLGPLTFLGRGPSTSNPNFVVPNVHQYSIGVQRELPWRMSLDITYAGSRSYDIEANFGGVNEPSAAFQRQCDVTQGGNRAFCDALLTNPFQNIPGFEGTTRFTNATLTRFELSRPFPAFTNFSQNQQNLGRMWYDSLQFVANKRWTKGVTVNASYTWVPRWTEDGANTTTGIGNAYVDEVSLLRNHGPYFSHRKHRLTASGVWELPWHRNRSLLGYLIGGWSIAPMIVFQTGQPWDFPGGVELAPGVNLADVALPGKKEGQFIYGAKPCVGQRNATTGQYALISVSQAYGCTEPYFLIREAFQRRTTMFRYDEFRRPSFMQVDVNFAKTTPITDNIRFQVRLEAFNLFNSPMYDERQYSGDTNSADFGRINRNSTGQSNFQRFIQMGFRLIF